MYAYIQLLRARVRLDSYFSASSSTCWSWTSNLWMQKWTLALIPSSSFKYGPILTSDITADGSPDDNSPGGLVAESWSMTVEPSVVVRTKLSDKQLENLVNYNPCKKYPLYGNIDQESLLIHSVPVTVTYTEHRLTVHIWYLGGHYERSRTDHHKGTCNVIIQTRHLQSGDYLLIQLRLEALRTQLRME